MSLVFILSNASTARETTKQTVTLILTSRTVLIKFGMIRNSRNSAKIEYSNTVILLLNICSYKVVTTDCHYNYVISC